MTVTMNPPETLDSRTVLLSWSSDQASPTYTVYRDGELHCTTTVAELVLHLEPGETAHIEVVDDAAAARPAFPARLTVTWWAVAAADRYLVRELVSGAWTDRASVAEDGRGFYRWRTRVLEDSQTHQFRVVAVGADDNESTAASLTVLMVRHPTPVSIAVSYAADHTLELSLA